MDAADLVTLRTAAAWFPQRAGRATSVDSVRKWIETGVRGIRLQAVRSGGEWFTCREWVEAFLQAREAARG